MTKYRDDNTESYSETDLALLNTVFDRLQNLFPNTHETNIADAINNAWQEGISEDDLYKSAARRLV